MAVTSGGNSHGSCAIKCIDDKNVELKYIESSHNGVRNGAQSTIKASTIAGRKEVYITSLLELYSLLESGEIDSQISSYSDKNRGEREIVTCFQSWFNWQ